MPGVAADLRFLTKDASTDELLAATAHNHLDWLHRLARGSGGTVSYQDGVHWTYVARTRREVTAAVTEAPGPPARAQLDSMLDFCRAERVDRVGYWAFSTQYQGRLGAWLGARGFRWGGRPHWMALDLHSLTEVPGLAELAAETGLAVTDSFEPREGTLLPCFDPDTTHVRAAMAAARPRRVWHGVQRDDDGEPVGQISLDMTSGPLGVCGLHDTVVVGDNRVKGIGIKRLLWVCRFALDLGCRYLVTNAADGNGALFGVWGFRTLGFGQTWWLPGDVLRQPVPPDTVAFAEAVGLGEVAALESMWHGGPDLDAVLPNGMTPLRLAGATGASSAAEWLLDRGAHPDVLAAWDLGWRQEAVRLVRSRPDLLQQRRPRSGKTLLHLAVERDDAELAELLLDAGIDTACTERRSGRTALEWARQLRRVGPASAILRHEGVGMPGTTPC